jgi:flagellar protein FlgJ
MSAFNPTSLFPGMNGAAGSGAGSLGVGSPLSRGLQTDVRSLQNLKSQAGQDPKAAIKDAARQLEGLFMQELVKSMRSTTMNSGMLDNAGTQMGTEMLDQQFAMQMTGIPRGLGDSIMKQLERQMNLASPEAIPMPGDDGPVVIRGKSARSRMDDAQIAAQAKAKPAQLDFVLRHQEAAKAAEEKTGIPASFMIGQAAHESGWGRRNIKNADGSDSHNLFGIKAGPSWTGKVATVTTTEYINGQPRKMKAQFRSYESHEAAFADYARMMKESPRYGNVVANADTAHEFARGMQKAGYATDPAYAEKLGRVINTTLRLQKLSG